jgi:hypothetical protein
MARPTADAWWVYPDFEVDRVAMWLDLPVNLTSVPEPGPDSKAPLYYVTELFGQVKVINNDGSACTSAS